MPKKHLPGRNYGSIPHLIDSHLGHHDKFIDPGQHNIILRGGRDRHDEVLVSLKLDGTNVGVLRTETGLIPLQRRGYDCRSSPYEQHQQFDQWVATQAEMFTALLAPSERLVGEWLWQASGTFYRIEGDPFYAFDLFNAEGERLPYGEFCRRCRAAGVRYIPSYSVENLAETSRYHLMLSLDFLTPGITPYGLHHEGLIFRVERREQFDYLAKWVRKDYRAGQYLPGIGTPKDAPLKRNQIYHGWGEQWN